MITLGESIDELNRLEIGDGLISSFVESTENLLLVGASNRNSFTELADVDVGAGENLFDFSDEVELLCSNFVAT